MIAPSFFCAPFSIFSTSVIGNSVLPVAQDKNYGFIIKCLFTPLRISSHPSANSLISSQYIQSDLWPLFSTFTITLDYANVVSQLHFCNAFPAGLPFSALGSLSGTPYLAIKDKIFLWSQIRLLVCPNLLKYPHSSE